VTPAESSAETEENISSAVMTPELIAEAPTSVKLHVVTAEDMPSESTSNRVQDFVEMIEGMFLGSKVPLTESYELYLEFDEDELRCGYYIVDHSAQCIFWLEDVSTEDVQINPAFSLEHLREYFTLITPF
jgi:hypothetical protein